MMKNLTYEEAFKEYDWNFSITDYGINNIEKLRLISLLCFLTDELRKKSKDTKVIDVIDKISKGFTFENKESYYPFLRNISFVCESLLTTVNGGVELLPFPTFGLKTTKEMVSEIRTIVNKYMPF